MAVVLTEWENDLDSQNHLESMRITINTMIFRYLCHLALDHWRGRTLLVFHINERPILMECLNLKLVQIGWKAPPPSFLPFGEILGSYCVTWHNFAKPYFMHHWTFHQWSLGRKAPPGGNFFLDWIYPFQKILGNLGLAGRKASPLWTGKFFLDWIYLFQTILSNFGFMAEKPPQQGIFFRLDLSILENFE